MKKLILSLFILIPISSQAWLANAPFKQKHLQLVAGTPGGAGNADGVDSVARFDQPGDVAVDSAGNIYVADTGYIMGTSNHTIRKITPSGVVTTFAGATGLSGSADGTGAAARFNFPQGIAVDSSGNVYVSDTGNNTIRKITPAGVVTTLAGAAGLSGSTNGTGATARFNGPRGITVDSSGNIFVADTFNHSIRKIVTAGVTTFAGLPLITGSADGVGAVAQFSSSVYGIAVDSSGNIFVADTGNKTIRKITPSGVVTTFAGVAGSSGSTDGAGAVARFSFPYDVAVDSSNNVYVADLGNDTIRKITPAGVVTTLAGLAGSYGSADGTGSAARFNGPQGVAVDSSGNVYVADNGNDAIRKITPGGVVTTFAGLAGSSGSTDGTGTAARFYSPSKIVVDNPGNTGNIYVADSGNRTIRKITSAGVVTTFAGTAGSAGSTNGTGAIARFNNPQGLTIDNSGTNLYVADTGNNTIRKIKLSDASVTTPVGTVGVSGAVDATGTAARFNLPKGVATDSSGNMYVADSNNSIIRKVTSAAVVTTFSGLTGMPGSADGGSTVVGFNYPYGVAAHSSGVVYVADTSNFTIRKVTSAGVVSTFAGTAGSSGTVDGTGAAARFASPYGLAVDSSGNVYVADSNSHTIRKITSAGVVSTIAGTAGSLGSANGTGAVARFTYPRGVAVDSSGNVYVADTQNHTIRKITSAGAVTTLAGTAGSVGSADGSGAAARFNYPYGIAVDSSGNVYVADSNNHTIRKITSAGVVTTLAGTAGSIGSVDGTGTAARFYSPRGIAVDNSGNVYVADTSNNTVRKITPAGVVKTVIGSVGVASTTLGPLRGFVSSPSSISVRGGKLYITSENCIVMVPSP